VVVFDDSFEHEVHFPSQGGEGGGGATRAVLIVDLWHPELDEEDRVFV